MTNVSRRFFLSSSAAFVAKAAIKPSLSVAAQTITTQFSSAPPSVAQASAFHAVQTALDGRGRVSLFDIFAGRPWNAPTIANQSALKATWSRSIDDCNILFRVYRDLQNCSISPAEFYNFLNEKRHHEQLVSVAFDEVKTAYTRIFPTIGEQLLSNTQHRLQSNMLQSLAKITEHSELWKSNSWTPLFNNLRDYARQRLSLQLIDGCLDGLSEQTRIGEFRELLRHAPELLPPERQLFFRQAVREFIRHGRQVSSFEEMNRGYTANGLPYRLGLSDLQNVRGPFYRYQLKTLGAA